MLNHTEVINYIIQQKGYKRYLEIGTQNGRNFDAILCNQKVGVDPDLNAKATHHVDSDTFFKDNTGKYDIVFLDGLHTAEQVRNDFVNAMASLSDGGVIVLHDTNPHSPEIATKERNTKEWCGDVWKFVCSLVADFKTLPFDYGVTVVKNGEYILYDSEPTWEMFDGNRNEVLGITTIHEFKKWL